MAGDNVVVVTDQNFEEVVIKSALPVLLDFWAPWCGPCRTMSPFVDEMATQYKGKLVVGKMNVDENPKTPQKYDVRGIPNLKFFKGGKTVDEAEIIGAVPKPKLEEAIGKVI